MSVEQLFDTVRPTGLVSAENLCSIVTQFALHKAVPLKEKLSGMAKFFVGDKAESLFQTGKEFTTPDENENCIMVDLNALYLINSVKLFLNNRITSYYIEISTYKETWTRAVDYSQERCSKSQEIYFPTSVVRFVKIVPEFCKFECNSLQIGYIMNLTKSLGAFVCPDDNVAVYGKAHVCYRNLPKPYLVDENLLNGTYEAQEMKTSYTAHTLNNGNIIFQFRQPYILSSCRFLMWDFDGRKYSYKIKVFSDCNWNYQLISDKSDELLDGWQRVDFAPRPVLRFCIEGVKATAGTELRLVHFEAPTQNQIMTDDRRKKMKLT